MKINKKKVKWISTHFSRHDGTRQYTVTFEDNTKVIYDMNEVPDKVYDFVDSVMPDQEYWEMSKYESWKRSRRKK